VDSLIIKGLTYYATLFTDLFLIFITTIALLIIDPYFTIFIFIYFILVGLILFKIQQSVSRKYGLTLSKIRLDFSDKIYEYHDNYREITLRGSKNIYNEELNKFREIQSITSAKSAFLQIQSKYIFESSIIFGAISFSLLQFLLKDIGHATVSLALFITAATRIAPTLLRLQNTLTQISGISGFSNSTIDLANLVVNEIIEPKLNESKKSLNLRLENVHFQYPENSAFALQDINLEIIHNSFTAIVGPTGSGKSTLLDLCLGFLTPSKGNIQLFGQLPNLFSVENPGKISIIPQRINITKGTIRDNISLGFFNIGTDEEFLWEVLKKVKLDDYIFNMPNKLDSTIGEFGSKISGGQRQRLAIARALYTSPIIIGFDEATSSLDAETEQSISEMLLLLRGNCTIITVAHRLSSIKNADSVIYMERGKILATGNFEEVKNSVPNFRTQANLMGL
jgi:ATP-binding cassette subfamily C protein